MTIVGLLAQRQTVRDRLRRMEWERVKRIPSSSARWFYKHITPDPEKTEARIVEHDDGATQFIEAEKRIPHSLEDEARIMDLRKSLERTNKLTNHIFDGIAHQLYGWPHMRDVAALIEMEESVR